jgi:formamidopyrimidine-DNA glycosylase
VPELPEVESVRRSLLPLIGRTVSRAALLRADFCTPHHAKLATPRDLLQSATITSLSRRGKQLAILAADGRVLVIHLGMTGQVLLLPSKQNPPKADHIHARWLLDDHSQFIFRDPRRFGGLWSLPSAKALAERWQDLGPDALDITSDHLRAAASRSARSIKAVLLDQSVLAGVGNIYADESLFRARIRPTRVARRIKPAEWPALAAAIRVTLVSAIHSGGSTLRDYIDANGQTGSAQTLHAVYGRGRKPCLICTHPLKEQALAQRTTVYCLNCQH